MDNNIIKSNNNDDNNDTKIEKIIVNHISFEEIKNLKQRNGSLYDLFTSQYFNINYLINYLLKRNEISVIDTLINILRKKYTSDSFFYLPQLCNLAINKEYTSAIEDFLIEMSINQMKFSLNISWTINCNIDIQDINQKNQYVQLAQKIETATINGKKNHQRYIGKLNKSKFSESEVLTKCYDRENRLIYFEECIKFYSELKFMCEQLFQHKPEDRKEILDKYIITFNEKIKHLRPSEERKNNRRNLDIPSENFFYGINLPLFDCFSNSDENNNLILRIIPSYSFCFKSKARVPVKLCVETIKVVECSSWDFLYYEKDDNIIINSNKSGVLDQLIRNFFNSESDKKDDIQTKYYNKSLEEFYKQMSKDI